MLIGLEVIPLRCYTALRAVGAKTAALKEQGTKTILFLFVPNVANGEIALSGQKEWLECRDVGTKTVALKE